jgi:hypothetical protein
MLPFELRPSWLSSGKPYPRRTGSFDEIAVLVPLPGPYHLDDDLGFAVLVLNIAVRFWQVFSYRNNGWNESP